MKGRLEMEMLPILTDLQDKIPQGSHNLPETVIISGSSKDLFCSTIQITRPD